MVPTSSQASLTMAPWSISNSLKSRVNSLTRISATHCVRNLPIPNAMSSSEEVESLLGFHDGNSSQVF